MLGLTEILSIVKAVLQFPNVILEFVHLLQKTPEENHEALMASIQKEADQFEYTGRPQW